MKTYIMLIHHFRWTVGFDNQSVGQFNLIKVVSKGLSTLKYFRINYDESILVNAKKSEKIKN